jgi:6-pyruvoyltetrahydropterin/6-carboxytetrahydropterin synthase
MYEIDIQRDFSAAHCLAGYPGNCARLHGHNWVIQAVLRTPRLDDLGIACDFRRLRGELDAVLADFDHRNLSELPEFKEVNPTSERLASMIFQRLAARINDGNLRVVRIRVCESPNSGATYYENE